MATIGLNERRQLTEFQDKVFKPWLVEFHALVGFPLAVEVKWDTFFAGHSGNPSSEALFKCWRVNFLDSTLETFRAACVDDMGRSAVKERVMSVVIEGVDSTSTANSKLEGGIFYTRFKGYNSNYSKGTDLANYWKRSLLAGL